MSRRQRRHPELFFFTKDILGSDTASEDENEDGNEDEDSDAGGDEDEDEDETPEDAVERLTKELGEATKGRRTGDRKIKNLTADLDKVKAELTKAKSGKNESEELKTATARISELESKLADREKSDTVASIKDSFRDSDKYAWHNRNTAFALLDLAEVDTDDNGRVDKDSLSDAIDALAKEHPYLLKKASADEDEDEEEPKPKPRSGAQSTRNTRTTKKTRQAAIAAKYGAAGRIPIT